MLKKAGSIIANVLAVAIVLFAVILAASSIASKGKGYVNILGSAYLSVASQSMEGDNKDSFNKGDVIRIKILNDQQKKECQVGQIITFVDYDITIDGVPQLNTHRIIEVVPAGGKVYYRTKGDNNDEPDRVQRASEDVVGVYKGKANGIGNVMLWVQTKNGFLVCVVVPSIIVLIYAIAMLIVNIIEVNKKKALADKKDSEEDLKAKIEAELREKILKEMQEKSGNGEKQG